MRWSSAISLHPGSIIETGKTLLSIGYLRETNGGFTVSVLEHDTTTISKDGVTVERDVEWKDAGVVCTLDFWSDDDTVATVTVVDRFPDDLPVEAVGFKDGMEPNEGETTDRAVNVTQTVSTEPTRVVYGVKLSTSVDGIRLDEPTITSVEDVDFVWTDGASNGGVSAEADSSPSRGTAPSQSPGTTERAGPTDAAGSSESAAPDDRWEPAERTDSSAWVDPPDAATETDSTDSADSVDSAGSQPEYGSIFSRFRRVYGRRSARAGDPSNRRRAAETDGGSTETIAVTPVETDRTDPAEGTTADAQPPDDPSRKPELTGLDRLRDRVEEVADCVESLETLEELERDVDTLSTRTTEHDEALETLQQTVLTLETELTAVDETVRAVRRDQEALRAELDELHAFRESMARFFAQQER